MKHLSRFVFFLIVLWSVSYVMPITAQDVPLSNEAIAMSYLNLAYSEQSVDAVFPLFSDSARIHNPLLDTTQLADLMSDMQVMYREVAGLTYSPYAVITQGDLVVVPYVWQGTLATFPGEAYVSGNAVDLFRFENGRIVELWHNAERHEFSILGSEEDYRTQLNMRVATVPSAETMGIPMLTDAAHLPTAVELTGIPNLADFPAFAWAAPASPLVAQTGIPMLTDFPVVAPAAPSGSQVTSTSVESIANTVPTALLPSLVVSDTAIVEEWLESYNHGHINRALMMPEFTVHTCPCDDGVGDMDINAYINTYDNALAEQVVPVWMPLVPEQGFTMVSEGGLTALMYRAPFSDAAGVAIFRVEDGRLAEMWQF